MHTQSTREADRAAAEDPGLVAAIGRWLMPRGTDAMARRHLLFMLLFLAVGVLASLLMRLELMSPEASVVTNFTYRRLFSLHGMLMVYFVLLPAFPGVLGHTLLPALQNGGGAVFPRLANAAWHLLALGGLLVVASFMTGGVGAGWAFDHEFGGSFLVGRALPTVAGIFLGVVGLLLLAVNTVATVWRLRAEGLWLWRGSPFALALLLGGLLSLPAYGMLLGCLVMMTASIRWGMPLFMPAFGGDPQLFLGLFRMFSVPVAFIVALPCLGLVTEVIRRHARRPVEGRLFPVALLMLAMAGLFAWLPLAGAASWVSSSALLAGMAGMLTVVALFSVLGQWLLSLRGGVRGVSTALLYALGGVFALAAAAMGGLLLLQPATFELLRNTTFLTAAAHTMAAAALGMAFLAGLHEALPRLTGRVISATAGRGPALAILVSVPLAFGPTLLLGLRGLLARQQTYVPEFQSLQVLATAGTTLLLGGVLAAALTLLLSRRPLSVG